MRGWRREKKASGRCSIEVLLLETEKQPENNYFFFFTGQLNV